LIVRRVALLQRVHSVNWRNLIRKNVWLGCNFVCSRLVINVLTSRKVQSRLVSNI
jgi:hypothetical protein